MRLAWIVVIVVGVSDKLMALLIYHMVINGSISKLALDRFADNDITHC